MAARWSVIFCAEHGILPVANQAWCQVNRPRASASASELNPVLQPVEGDEPAARGDSGGRFSSPFNAAEHTVGSGLGSGSQPLVRRSDWVDGRSSLRVASQPSASRSDQSGNVERPSYVSCGHGAQSVRTCLACARECPDYFGCREWHGISAVPRPGGLVWPVHGDRTDGARWWDSRRRTDLSAKDRST